MKVASLVAKAWIMGLLAMIAVAHGAGDPESLGQLDEWVKEPPPGENAAELYLEAFRLARGGEEAYSPPPPVPFIGDASLPGVGDPLPPDMRQAIREYLKSNSAALEKLHEASAYEESKYPLEYASGFDMFLGHLPWLRWGARVLYLEAVVAMHEGDSELARCVVGIWAIGRSLAGEPLILSQLLRWRVQAMACEAIERAFNCVSMSEDDLVRLDAALSSVDVIADIQRALLGERIMVMSRYESEAFQDVMAQASEAAGQGFPNALQGSREVLRRAEDKMATDPVLAFVPDIAALMVKAGEHLALVRCARTAIAIERYRLANHELPERLSDLHPEFMTVMWSDPFDGEPLRYQRRNGGYTIYSIGSPGQDKSVTEFAEAPPDAEGAIAFTVNRHVVAD